MPLLKISHHARRNGANIWVMSEARPHAAGPRGPVLIVDPDPALGRIVQQVLEGAGWPARAARSAEDAFPLVPQYRPKLVLAEVTLEGAGGPELARCLAETGGWRPRVALMSAYPRPPRGLEDYFLAKPLQFDHLLMILETIEAEPGW